MSNLASLQYFVPELFLTAAILVIIVIDLLLKEDRKIITAYLSAAAGIIALLLAFNQYYLDAGSLFQGMIVLDSFAVFFKIITALSTVLVIFMSIPSIKARSEYYILMLIVTLGMFIMAQVNDLLMILIAMEIVGIMSYVLAGFKKGSSKSMEASLKYVLFGAASTAVMAFGFSYIYGLTGHTNLYEIQQALVSSPPNKLAMFVAFVLVLGGLGYKIALVPFHFWVPDVYEGAPTPITAFIAVGPKAAGLALFARFVVTVVAHPASAGSEAFLENIDIQVPLLIAVLSVVTMTLGNLSALQQKNLKRMLAYSAIAHVGYIMMAFVVLNKQGFVAIMFYIVVYMFMNFGAFWIIESMAEKLGGEDVDNYSGLGFRAPFVAVAMAIFLFSLAGIPPLAGFIGKVYLFSAIIKEGWYVLALIGVLNSALSIYYYAYVSKAMFFDKVDEVKPVAVSLYDKILILVFLIPTVLLGIYWNPLIQLADRSLGFFFGR